MRQAHETLTRRRFVDEQSESSAPDSARRPPCTQKIAVSPNTSLQKCSQGKSGGGLFQAIDVIHENNRDILGNF
jgi:hypothetical protein